jgi:hypothetical protein
MIFKIALGVVIVGAAIIYGRSLVRKGREKKDLHRRRVQDEERRRLFFSPERITERGEQYRKMEKARKEAGGPVLTKPYPPGGGA